MAAVPGLIDYLFIRPDKEVRGTATLHMLLNIAVLGESADRPVKFEPG